MKPSQPSLGLIAGEGEFPKLVLRGARRAGLRVVVVALKGSHDPDLGAEADVFYKAGIARLGRWIRIFRREGAQRAVMAGRVRKSRMLDWPRWRQILAYLPDWTSIKLWFFTISDRRNDTLLSAVADEMARKGIELIDSTTYCPQALASVGPMTHRSLSAAQQADADLGWKIARALGQLDIGQSVAVKDRDVIAVEAIEGTDAMIQRAGQLCKSRGWTLVKVAKPDQDMRFDVPTIGPKTIQRMIDAGGGSLVVEAGKTLCLERQRMIDLANERGIVIVGRTASDPQP